jgi:hypothetical protein
MSKKKGSLKDWKEKIEPFIIDIYYNKFTSNIGGVNPIVRTKDGIYQLKGKNYYEILEGNFLPLYHYVHRFPYKITFRYNNKLYFNLSFKDMTRNILHRWSDGIKVILWNKLKEIKIKNNLKSFDLTGYDYNYEKSKLLLKEKIIDFRKTIDFNSEECKRKDCYEWTCPFIIDFTNSYKCKRCSRDLSLKSSILRGYGQRCWEKMKKEVSFEKRYFSSFDLKNCDFKIDIDLFNENNYNLICSLNDVLEIYNHIKY